MTCSRATWRCCARPFDTFGHTRPFHIDAWVVLPDHPVKHGHAGRAAEWPFSRFHRYVARGVYALDWGGAGVAELVAGNGE